MTSLALAGRAYPRQVGEFAKQGYAAYSSNPRQFYSLAWKTSETRPSVSVSGRLRDMHKPYPT